MRHTRWVPAWLAAGLAVVSLALSAAPAQRELLVYFGTYSGPTSKGVYVSRLNLASGTLTAPELAIETRNPSFLAVHGSQSFMYAVNEVGQADGKPGGTVSAFAVDRVSGKLTLLNQQPSGGADPAHLSVDRAGRHVLVANYTGGSVAVLPIAADGRLAPASSVVQHRGSSVNQQRQQRPHAHSINLDPQSRFAYVADLGLDKVMIYRFDPAKGSLAATTPAFAAVVPGSGPRHVAIHPGRPFAYVINEMTCAVTAFRRDVKRGGLAPLQTISTLPAGQRVEQGYSTAEIAVHPSGRFLYGSNRGHDTIAVFAIERSGTLRLVEHEPTQGSTPRGFGIDPGGAYLLAGNQRSDSVVVFRIDGRSGALTPTGQTITVGSPVSVEFIRPRGASTDTREGTATAAGGRPSTR